MYGGKIEQMGTPSEMYQAPATPFVAEFIGTMNRLEATVVDSATGEVEHRGTRLKLGAAQGLPRGERVLVLARPETLELTAAEDGAGGLVGDVVTHTFLGPVTRLKVLGDEVELIADVPTARVEALPIGMRVAARIPDEGLRLLSLAEQPEEAPVPPASGQDGP
jgi:putative spermidine/putrescine transport system ATP-binding protein